jgi:uncharacterized protein
MKYLLDTNIFLELLLGNKNSTQAEKFINSHAVSNLAVSDFSIHSNPTTKE